MPDMLLLQAYTNHNDAEALGSLYKRYMELIYGVCLKYLKQRELAQDAVMNIYEEITTKTKKYEIDNFKAWIHTVAKNHCLMHLRSIKNKPYVAMNDAFMQLDNEVHLNMVMEQETSFIQLENCIQTLEEQQKVSVTLFYYQQKCYKEIADITGYALNKVRSNIQNGRRNLKLCMDKHE